MIFQVADNIYYSISRLFGKLGAMSIDFKTTYIAYCDGACSGNPGPGGWGVVIASPKGTVKELGGHAENTTNNQMELQAVIETLRFLSKNRGELSTDLAVLTDSVYVIKGISQWIWAWKKNDWKSSTGEPVANIEYWKELSFLVGAHKKNGKISWHYVRGHNNNPGNDRVDEIAVCFSKKKYFPLYSGPLLNYDVAIHDIPEDTSVPERKATPIGEKKKAYSYISVVNGEPKRHLTWSECEARVKGRSGAKFKKTASSDDEMELLIAWGIDPKVVSE